ncbi:beta-N-acetylhexosaminidase [Paenibacillus sp. CAA11]|uniref:beta-N-acetylhexosaminidase n=1 Tax=Paenibacillus sp. CAA11 TaxID=1532905 RepID=UPI00131F10EB|nr:family 20 glycosylhydrolase [Paenibacillus sp. CAA11]
MGLSIPKLQVLPEPKKMLLHEGVIRLSRETAIVVVDPNPQINRIARQLQTDLQSLIHIRPSLSAVPNAAPKGSIFLKLDTLLDQQQYILDSTGNQLQIYGGSPEALHYAKVTLCQIIHKCGANVSRLTIEDQPDFAARGLMLDIGRNRIPKLNTLFRIVDLMANLKMNQLQLYIEGVPFAYESFPHMWKGQTPISGDEIMQLSNYCQERYIELVPNQNSFGHMEDWLAHPDFRDLAEKPEGFEFPRDHVDPDMYPNGWPRPPGTLDPSDPRVLPFLERTYDDLLPYFDSRLFNVGCDETFELGLGNSKALSERLGKGRVYLDFLLKIYSLLKTRGKTMMFWGDIILQHPELIPELPNDIIALEWGYEGEHPFDLHGAQFASAGIPFYVCPGTSSWNSLSGRTTNMLSNIRNAAVHGKAHGAIGFLVTDWGDNGHLQPLSVSYPGIVFSGFLSWNAEHEHAENLLASYLDEFVFQDSEDKLGQTLLDFGNSYLQGTGTPRPNDTELMMLLRSDLDNLRIASQWSKESLDRMENYLLDIDNRLGEAVPGTDDADYIIHELRTALQFQLHAVGLGRLKLALKDRSAEPNCPEISTMARHQLDHLQQLLTEYMAAWSSRSRPGGFLRSIHDLQRLCNQYAALL